MFHRRRFLEATGAVGVLGAMSGGLYLRAASRRGELSTAMIRDAHHELSPKAHRELQHLPIRARTEIRDWFHSHCLNAAEFAYEVCSPRFAERLAACDNSDLQQQCVADLFLASVVSAEEVQERLQVIAQEMGNELDFNWHACCETLAEKWQIHVDRGGHRISLPSGLADRLDSLVRQSLAQAIDAGRAGAAPALSSISDGLGKTALLLIPLAMLAPNVALPAFFVRAIFNLGQYVVRLLSDRVGDAQAAITTRVAILGRRLGSEFEGEARARIADLHAWQENAVSSFAHDYARRAIPLF